MGSASLRGSCQGSRTGETRLRSRFVDAWRQTLSPVSPIREINSRSSPVERQASTWPSVLNDILRTTEPAAVENGGLTAG
jgi:hypothetical protein